MKLYLVRHGKSLRSKIGVWGRRFDADLDPDYLHQLTETRTILAGVPDLVAFSSPLSRCIHTATLVLPRSVNIDIVPEFTAYYSGDFEDKTEAFVQSAHPDYPSRSFRERFLDPQFNEESIAAQAERVKSGLHNILSTTATAIVVSTHYSVINVIANVAAGNYNIASYADGRFDVPEGGLLVVAIDQEALRRTLSGANNDGRTTSNF